MKIYGGGAGDPPFVSTLNLRKGETRANLAVVPVEWRNSLRVTTSAGEVHVAVDLVGYFSKQDGDRGDRITLTNPSRALDTRQDRTTMAPGATRRVVFAGRNGVPANANAVIVNLTAITGAGHTYVTGYAAGDERPLVSNLNAPPNSIVPNLAVVPLGHDGAADFFSAGATDLVIDVVGYTAGGATTEAGRLLPATTPTRVFDTRTQGRPVVRGVRSAQQVGGVPTNAPVGLRPAGVIMNTTATDATSGTYVTVHAADSAVPWASSLNVDPGRAVANLVMSRLDAGGSVNLVNGFGTVHVVGDVAGYLSAA